MPTSKPATLTIWRFVDGKPGHEKQSLALIEGLQAHRKVITDTISVQTLNGTLRTLITGRWPNLDTEKPSTPPPDIVIGAGHATHLALLAAKRAFGAKAVVIMNPSLPASLFDAIITPAHDGYSAGGNRLVTPTALAPSVNSQPHDDQGLVLLGGLNKHFAWPESEIVAMVQQLVSEDPETRWQISNSRRTPVDTSNTLQRLCEQNSNASFIDVEHCPANWLAEQLKHTGEIWITKDSASMVAEALNTLARVGLIDLPPIKVGKNNKIGSATEALITAGEVGLISVNQRINAPKRTNAANHHLQVAKHLVALLDQ